MKRDTIGPAAAGVHIVCADLFMFGFRAFVAAEGLHYDVVLDTGPLLHRIQVKSTGVARPRSGRPGSPPIYRVGTDRGHRPPQVGAKAELQNYNQDEIDLLACVALDIRTVAYFAVLGQFVGGMNLYPPGTMGWERDGVTQRRNVDQYPIDRALLHVQAFQLAEPWERAA